MKSLRVQGPQLAMMASPKYTDFHPSPSSMAWKHGSSTEVSGSGRAASERMAMASPILGRFIATR